MRIPGLVLVVALVVTDRERPNLASCGARARARASRRDRRLPPVSPARCVAFTDAAHRSVRSRNRAGPNHDADTRRQRGPAAHSPSSSSSSSPRTPRTQPVGEVIVDSVLSKQIDDLEPTLTRHGYTAKVLTEMLGTKPGEIKALFKQTLEVDRARELKE